MKKALLTVLRVILSIVFTIVFFLFLGLIGVLFEKLNQLPIGTAITIVLTFLFFIFFTVLFYKGIKQDLF